jgi:Fibronectin type III domain/BspA type Leucine rich repeat region (6 copies)
MPTAPSARAALGAIGAVALVAATVSVPAPAAAAPFTLTCTQTLGDATTPYSVSVNDEMFAGAAGGCGGVLTIPEGVTQIHGRAFLATGATSNPHITSIVFPSSLLYIQSVGLGGLTGVTSLTFPANVLSFANQSLAGMTSLQTLRIEGSPTSTTYVSDYAFRFDTVDLSIGNGNVTFNWLAMNDATIETLDLGTGSGAITFGVQSFYGQQLSSLTLPARVTTIDDRAFGSMANLSEVDFGATTPGLTSIHANAFQGTGITSVRYCGGNAVLDAYLTASLPNADVFCSTTQVPEAPTLASTSAGNGSVTVTATPGAANTGRALSNYAVQYSSDGTTWMTYTRSPASTSTTITVPSLTNGTPYQFRVAAISLAGTSTYSAASAAVTPVAPVTSTPSNPVSDTPAPTPMPTPSPTPTTSASEVSPAAPAAVVIPEPVAAGEGLVVVDGRATKLVVKSATGNTWQVVGEDFSLDVAPQGLTGRLEGSFTARAGERVRVTGEGFAPSSLIAAYVPGALSASLGEARVGADGTFDIEALIPASLQPGQYVFQVNGLATQTWVRSVNLGMTLLPSVRSEVRAASLNVAFIPTTSMMTTAGARALATFVRTTGRSAASALIVPRVHPTASAAQMALARARAGAVADALRDQGFAKPVRIGTGARRVDSLRVPTGAVLWLREK